VKDSLNGATIRIGILVVLVLGFFGSSTYDYGFKCTKCLRDSHVVEKRVFGITYWRSSRLRFEGYDLKPITGSACQHVFRKNGFGDGIGCGLTAEGGLFKERWEGLASAFKLNETVRDNTLLRKTLFAADSYLPPDATISYQNSKEGRETLPKLYLLSFLLRKAQNRAEWEAALAQAEAGELAVSN
jgi:hypothetical protein